MTIDEIFTEWEKDSVIDRTELGREATNIPKLHYKYYRMYIQEKSILIKWESELKKFSALRTEFYAGTIDDDTLNEMNWMEEWKHLGRKTILKTEIPRYLESDQKVIDRNLKINIQKEKVALLDSIIKSFVNRGFQIKSDIEWSKFQVGA